MSIRIVHTCGEIPESTLSEFEKYFGGRLPPDFREFLLAHNAREIEPGTLPVTSVPGNPTVAVKELCCFCKGQSCDYYYIFKKFYSRIPPGFIPIARDPGGNLFIMSLNETERGAVYFWEHEAEADEGDPPSLDNIYKVAESFNDMINILI